jgi:hypothetical protein
MFKEPKNYLKKLWNYFEILPLILILINIYRHQKLGSKAFVSLWFYEIQTIASLTIWLKFTYFLRSFDSLAFMIKGLEKTVRNIPPFIAVLLLCLVGFAGAFNNVRNAQMLGEQS